MRRAVSAAASAATSPRTTVAPRSRRVRATASPIPPATPGTRATRPARALTPPAAHALAARDVEAEQRAEPDVHEAPGPQHRVREPGHGQSRLDRALRLLEREVRDDLRERGVDEAVDARRRRGVDQIDAAGALD